jgi:hypothetical protein
MGPVNLVVGYQHKLIFSPLPHWLLWEKLDTDPQTGQPSCCGLGRELFSSGAVDLFKSVDDYAKGCYALTG